MEVLVLGAGTMRQAPMPLGPSVEVLFDDPTGHGQLAVAHFTIPAGGGMPQHLHGASATLLVMLDGEVRVRGLDEEHTLATGGIIFVAQGEKVGLANGSNRPASLLTVFAPADFIRRFASWPAATGQ